MAGLPHIASLIILIVLLLLAVSCVIVECTSAVALLGCRALPLGITTLL